jgi:cell division protein FtsQ
MLQATRRTVAETALPKLHFGNALSLASVLLLVVAAVAFLAGAVRTAVLLQARSAIASVQVEGVPRDDDRRQVALTIAPASAGNYFTVDLGAIRAAAMQLPWVEEVRVSRRWPDGVRVDVRSKQPVALWGTQGFISSRGDLFVPTAAVNTAGLPVLFGPADKTVYVMEQYRAMNSILRNLGMSIAELRLTDRMSWFLRLDNGMRLMVDQADTIDKLQRFSYLYERQLKPDAGNIATVDLRYRNGVAVGWRVQKDVRPDATRT